ncbi:MAG: hypothetical protein C5B59_04930 [Bacteroidetes bacterium]|nr:MAG: hypothetical protein C5B59_04930 [Bacteroidota bacterium]
MQKKLIVLLSCLIPLAENSLRAQTAVPVFEEPRHQVVLLNKWVRLMDVRIPPHDTTLYHHHFTQSAIVFLSKTATGSRPMGGEKSSGQSIPGVTMFADFGNKPVIHRVWNEDTVLYHVMDIEILNQGDTTACPIIQLPDIQLNWEKKYVRSYSIKLAPGKNFLVNTLTCPHLLIAITGKTIVNSDNKIKKMSAGEFYWLPDGTDIQINNSHSEAAEFVLLELK